MKIVHEKSGYQRLEEFEKCSFFCPNCGIQSVWQQQGPNGKELICTSCSVHFLLHGPWQWYGEDNNAPREIGQLRSGATLTPTTPRSL